MCSGDSRASQTYLFRDCVISVLLRAPFHFKLTTAFYCNKKHAHAENLTVYCNMYFDLPAFYLISLFHAEYYMHITSLQYFILLTCSIPVVGMHFQNGKNILILIRWLIRIQLILFNSDFQKWDTLGFSRTRVKSSTNLSSNR